MSAPFREPRRLIARGEAGRHGVLAESLVLSRAECEGIMRRVLAASTADATRVRIESSVQSNVRFADNQMSTSGITEDASVAVTAVVGRRRASATTNDLSDAGLRAVVAQATALARLAPEDPELLPDLGPTAIAPVAAWFVATAGLSAQDRARAAVAALAPARAASDLVAAGYIEVTAQAVAVGNGAGHFAYHPSTNANVTLTVRTRDGTGSGWAGAEANDWATLDFDRLAQRALTKARASRNPVAIEPGRYTVVFEPQGASDLLRLIGGALDARTAAEGRSAFATAGGGTKVGERIMDPRVSIVSDPADALLLGQPFDGEGFPLGRQAWVRDGVLQQLATSRYWAQRTGATPTGGPSTFKVSGGSASLEQLIASTGRGVLVTRCWYLRQVDARTLVQTGLTRDGTFLIEDGKVARSIKNFRFNDSPLFMLANLDDLGAPVRVTDGGIVAVPPLKVRDFSFTSLSDAV